MVRMVRNHKPVHRLRGGRKLSAGRMTTRCISRTMMAFWSIAMMLSVAFLVSYNNSNDTSGHLKKQGSTRRATYQFVLEDNDRRNQAPPSSVAIDNNNNNNGEKGLPGLKSKNNNNNNKESSWSTGSQFFSWHADTPPRIPEQQQQQQQNDAVPGLEGGFSSGDTNSFGLNDRSYDVIGCENNNFDHTIFRPTHGCQINKQTFMVFCNLEHVKVDVSKIQSDRGGEPLASVMGRSEAKEMPIYEKGAFVTDTPPTFEVPKKFRMNMHYMTDVLNNLVYPTKKNKGKVDMSCTETWQGTTMFITRYEYVNLFHTMTDWFNAFLSLPSKDDGIRLVFLDAHAEGNLDSVWNDVFSEYTYVQHLPKGGVCFEKAIFIPPGYISPIYSTIIQHYDVFGGRENCPHHERAVQFSNMFLESYNLPIDDEPIKGKIIIIDRQHYVSHPRSQPAGQAQRTLTNLKELKKALRGIPGVTSVSLVRFETMTFREQLRTVRQAQIVIGNHGAGLSHVMFMNEKSTLVEFSTNGADYFAFLAEWKGVSYRSIMLDGDDMVLRKSAILEAFQFVKMILAQN